MKKWFIVLAALVLVVLCAVLLPTEAKAASASDLTFEVNSDGKSYYVDDCNASASGKLIIPATYNGKPVTSIGDWAFSNCDSLTSVTIPDSVTSIGVSAFFHCNSLTSVTIPDSVTRIGAEAFYFCDSLTSVTIPDSVTSIGYEAFRNCTSLTAITVSSGNPNFSSDKQGVLYNKDKTTLIQAPGAIKTCVIPDSVTSIGDSAFYDCDNLTSVTIPDCVTSIGDYAFDRCNCLSVTYCGTQEQWGGIAMDVGAGNEALKTVRFHAYDSDSDAICNICGENKYMTGIIVTIVILIIVVVGVTILIIKKKQTAKDDDGVEE